MTKEEKDDLYEQHEEIHYLTGVEFQGRGSTDTLRKIFRTISFIIHTLSDNNIPIRKKTFLVGIQICYHYDINTYSIEKDLNIRLKMIDAAHYFNMWLLEEFIHNNNDKSLILAETIVEKFHKLNIESSVDIMFF